MSVITKHKLIISIPEKSISGEKMTATDAMSIVDNDIYCICSKHDDISKYPVVLHKFYNYLPEGNTGSYKNSDLTTEAGSKIIAKHSNSLTYYNHVFYMVTRNGTGSENQVMAFGSDGIIKSKYTYADGEIGTINFYKNKDNVPWFLISIGGGTSITYRLVKVSGSKFINTGISFKVNVPDVDYSIGNDSYYDFTTKQLYITKFKKIMVNGTATVRNNRIYQYDLNCELSGSSATFDAKRILQIDGDSEETKFEIEGLAVYDSKKYVCANVVSSGKNCDAIYKLYT